MVLTPNASFCKTSFDRDISTTCHVHVIEVELRETTFLSKRDARFAQGKIEMFSKNIGLLFFPQPNLQKLIVDLVSSFFLGD